MKRLNNDDIYLSSENSMILLNSTFKHDGEDILASQISNLNYEETEEGTIYQIALGGEKDG